MSTTKTIPIITDPAAFVAEQYAVLSTNWDTLTGKEQFDIINAKFASIASGTKTVNGVLPSGTPDAQYKQIAFALAQAHIYKQSGNNEEVADYMGYKDVTALAEAE